MLKDVQFLNCQWVSVISASKDSISNFSSLGHRVPSYPTSFWCPTWAQVETHNIILVSIVMFRRSLMTNDALVGGNKITRYLMLTKATAVQNVGQEERHAFLLGWKRPSDCGQWLWRVPSSDSDVWAPWYINTTRTNQTTFASWVLTTTTTQSFYTRSKC